MENIDKKIAVIFPGIGYHADKPLLYYAIDIADSYGYEHICVNYGELTKNEIKEDIRQSIEKVMESVERQLSEFSNAKYQEILFISKSIGSVVAAEYVKRHNVNARQIVYTPIQETLSYHMENAIVFHGTKDSWCKTKDLKEVCTKNHNQLWILEDANHSLEVNSTMKNIDNLKMIMKKTEDYIKHRN